MELSGRRILIVDDVKFTRITLLKMLRQLGDPVILEAADGEAALAVLEAERQGAPGIECVITDLEMPRLDGLSLLKAIRVGTGAIPRDLPVIVLTGHSELDRLGAALLLDVDGFLAKPTSRQAIERCLEQVFYTRHGNGPSALATAETYRQVELVPPSAESDILPASAGERREVRVSISAVPIDAVLARDLLFGNGRLLLRAQTRMNARIAQRLRELAPLSGVAVDVWILE